MASDYGLNFGFRRSDESVRVSEGRFRTPATGSALQQGVLVTIDAANPGYLKVAAANSPAVPGVTGLLVQEEVWDRSIYETSIVDSFLLGVCKLNRLSVITTGAGTKFWLHNSSQQTRADGRVIAAVTMFDATGLTVGGQLGWDGAKYVNVDGTTVTKAVATVTFLDTANGRLEAVLVA